MKTNDYIENYVILVCITFCIVFIALITDTLYGFWSMVFLLLYNFKYTEKKGDK